MSKKKILSILIITILFCVCVLNSKVFATNIVTIDASNTSVTTPNTGAGTITITSGNTATNNTTNTNTTNNTTNTNTSVNNLTSSNNVAKNNVSSYNNISNKANTSAGLPYTGSNSSIVFIVIAFVASAIYAYKKIRDYNI